MDRAEQKDKELTELRAKYDAAAKKLADKELELEESRIELTKRRNEHNQLKERLSAERFELESLRRRLAALAQGG